MNLAFLDPIPWDYDVASPFERPLGGSQSAMCYLALALAARGHSVSTYTGIPAPREVRGVHCRPNVDMRNAELAEADVLVVVNGPAEAATTLRPQLPRRTRLVLWTQHATDQPAMLKLEEPQVRSAWDAIVCVSNWHATTMHQRFNLNPARITVKLNAISPAFTNLFADPNAMIAAKSEGFELAYTSTPFRGLNVLLSVFPEFLQADARLRLRVFSSMKVYGKDETADKFASLYAACRSTPNVEYVGSLPQPELAPALRSALFLAYPNTFPETSCIAAMEAMAAGLLVVTSDLGALPETTMGAAVIVAGPKKAEDVPEFARVYRDAFIATMHAIGRDPQKFWQARWDQVRAMNTRFTWPVRAAEWEALFTTL